MAAAVEEKTVTASDGNENSLKHRSGARTQACIMLVITAAMVLINAAAWLIDGFADFYMEKIFHITGNLSMITSLIPFSLGEVLIALGILLITVGVVFFCIMFVIVRKDVYRRKKWAAAAALIYGWVLVYIFTSETLNCFINYHTTEFSEKYHGSAGADGFTSEQLVQLCGYAIDMANEYSERVGRAVDGSMLLPDDLNELAAEAMRAVSEDYPPLRGAYPQPKLIRSSVLMTQLELQGIYFPFTLEANYNSELMPARVPCTICHELSHVKGYIREDEACFIAFRACVNSDVPELCYSGWLSAMNYLYSAVRSNVGESELKELYIKISPLVLADNKFVSEEFTSVVEEKAIIPTETASRVSESAMDTSLKLNGVSDGKKSYGRMVDLLLEYYYCVEVRD